MSEVIASLREQIETLEAERDYWRDLAQCEDLAVPPSWRFTKCEAFLTRQLARREVLSRDIAASMWPGRTGADVEGKAIDVLLHRVRKKLRSRGFEIRTEWGVGWYLEPADRARLRALLKSREDAA